MKPNLKKRARLMKKHAHKKSILKPIIIIGIIFALIFFVLFFGIIATPFTAKFANKEIPDNKIVLNAPGNGGSTVLKHNWIFKDPDGNSSNISDNYIFDETDDTDIRQILVDSEKTLDDFKVVENVDASDNKLEIYFLDVGQGDCILIKYIDLNKDDGDDSCSALIDAGDTTKGTYIHKFLLDHDVEALKYFICTHPDEDHIGGAASVVSNTPIENILGSTYVKETTCYENLMNEIKYNNYVYCFPSLNTEYKLGKAFIKFIGPIREYEDSNNSSLIFILDYYGTTFYFGGDSEEEAETSILVNNSQLLKDIDVYKVSHHGSDSSSSKIFLSLINPSVAVISVGAENKYGHPSQTVIDNLDFINCKYFRTDIDGTVKFEILGENPKEIIYTTANATNEIINLRKDDNSNEN